MCSIIRYRIDLIDCNRLNRLEQTVTYQNISNLIRTSTDLMNIYLLVLNIYSYNTKMGEKFPEILRKTSAN